MLFHCSLTKLVGPHSPGKPLDSKKQGLKWKLWCSRYILIPQTHRHLWQKNLGRRGQQGASSCCSYKRTTSLCPDPTNLPRAFWGYRLAAELQFICGDFQLQNCSCCKFNSGFVQKNPGADHLIITFLIVFLITPAPAHWTPHSLPSKPPVPEGIV